MTRPLRWSLFLLCGIVLPMGAGCQLAESLVDGFYGGISDTVSAAISGFLLGES